jgi:hypothetical protein
MRSSCLPQESATATRHSTHTPLDNNHIQRLRFRTLLYLDDAVKHAGPVCLEGAPPQTATQSTHTLADSIQVTPE